MADRGDPQIAFDGFLTPVEDHPQAGEIAAALAGAAPPLPPLEDPGRPSFVPPSMHGDPLVEVAAADLLVIDAYDGSRSPRGDLPIRLRRGVCERLLAAQESLPSGFSLAILDGWRSLEFQSTLGEFYGEDAVKAGYVSPVGGSGAAAPPHVTGGAVDVTLAWSGDALALGTDFDAFNERAHAAALENDPGASRDARRLLFQALTSVGFAPYRWEWWHFSFGDSHWAAWAGASAPLYGSADARSQE